MSTRRSTFFQPDLLNPRGHENCRHKEYALSCTFYNVLLDRAKGMCEICRLPGLHNFRRKLYIDHDYTLGHWAVRGLLCSDCNMNLGRRWREDERDQDFLDNPFWREVLKACGVDEPDMAEPGIGWRVTDFYKSVWIREPDHWREIHHLRRRTGHKPAPRSRNWWQLYRANGPHVLRHAMTPPGAAEAVVAELRKTVDPVVLAEVARLLAGGA